jgi:FkbM family methyltransferase
LRLWAFAVRAAPANSVVLDVGAFAGLYSLVATSVRIDVRAIAFEPATMTYGRLARNILWNQLDMRVIAANLAVSDQAASITFIHAISR